jgi:hypothetical protein
VFGSDDSWRSTPSHPRRRPHLRRDPRPPSPSSAGPSPARTAAPGTVRVAIGQRQLCPTIGPPVRHIESSRPCRSRAGPRSSRRRLRPEQPRLGPPRPRPARHRVTLTYGEWLDADGDVTQANLCRRVLRASRPLPFQTDIVIRPATARVRAPLDQRVPVRRRRTPRPHDPRQSPAWSSTRPRRHRRVRVLG